MEAPAGSAVTVTFAGSAAVPDPGRPVQPADRPAGHRGAARHSGAPALALRMALGGKVIAYTGDTAWTGALAGHRPELTSRRIVLTHLSADMLDPSRELDFETAHDGLVIQL